MKNALDKSTASTKGSGIDELLHFGKLTILTEHYR